MQPPVTPSSWRELRQAFRVRFHEEPTVYAQAPGRVNLIGEHTDYNDGLVLPAAVNRYVRVAARRTTTQALRLHSLTLAEDATLWLEAFSHTTEPSWGRYAAGILFELKRRGVAPVGMDVVIGGDLAIGAGLSSSAAFEVALALVLEDGAGKPLAARETALACWAAETAFVGVPCGIMDQFASALCTAGAALFLDCRSRETHHLPIGENIVLAVCDTGIRRALATSAYRLRRDECEAAVAALHSRGHALRSLRDLALVDLPLIDHLPFPLNHRARHVVTENARVLEVTRNLTAGTPEALRDIFVRSQQSLRDDYEVSSPELDTMVEAALRSPACLAARMTGAGFGGAVVALVRAGHEEAFIRTTGEAYERETGSPGKFFVSPAVYGATILSFDELASEDDQREAKTGNGELS